MSLAAIEQTHHYSGRYFVLMGHLSPLDGIGPKELGLINWMNCYKAGVAGNYSGNEPYHRR